MIRSESGHAYMKEIVDGKCFCSWECVQPNNLIFNRAGLSFLFRRFVARALGTAPPPAPSSAGFAADPCPVAPPRVRLALAGDERRRNDLRT
jgi:hypothetical protein